METVTEASTSPIAMYVVMMLMGYAIIFAYLFIALAKKEIGYIRKDYERDLKYFEKHVERDFQRLRDENMELRRELIKLENKGLPSQ